MNYPKSILIDENIEIYWTLYKINRSRWTATANSEQEINGNDGPASFLMDDNHFTIWHSMYSRGHDDRTNSSDPFQITIDLGERTSFKAFSYMPRQGGDGGQIRHYDFYVAETREELNTKILNNEYLAKGDIDYNSRLSTLIIFPSIETGRFISFRSLNHDGHGTCAEINLYKDPTNSPTHITINETTDVIWSPYKIDRTRWVVSANSEKTLKFHSNIAEGSVSFIIDNNSSTIWHSRYTPSKGGHDDRNDYNDPFQITIDLGERTSFKAFSYMPRQDDNNNGNFVHYEFYVADTQEELNTKILNNDYLSKGDIDYLSKNSMLVAFPSTETGRFIAILSLNHIWYGSCAEFNLHKEPPNLPNQITIDETCDVIWSPNKIDRKGWIVTANSEHETSQNIEGPASNIIDGDSSINLVIKTWKWRK